jgi:hypothetical protein
MEDGSLNDDEQVEDNQCCLYQGGRHGPATSSLSEQENTAAIYDGRAAAAAA